jgi:hypothetical protein
MAKNCIGRQVHEETVRDLEMRIFILEFQNAEIHPSKADSSIISTELEIRIDVNAEQFANASFSMQFSLEPGPSMIVSSCPHLEKHSLPRISTEDDIRIDLGDERRAMLRRRFQSVNLICNARGKDCLAEIVSYIGKDAKKYRA